MTTGISGSADAKLSMGQVTGLKVQGGLGGQSHVVVVVKKGSLPSMTQAPASIIENPEDVGSKVVELLRLTLVPVKTSSISLISTRLL